MLKTIRKILLTSICLGILILPAYAARKEDTLHRATVLIEQHKYDKALVLLDEFLKENPNHTNGLLAAAKAARLTGQIDRAADYMETLKPKLTGLEALWLREGQFDMYYRAGRQKDTDRTR